MLRELITGCFATALVGTAAYAQAKSAATPPESVNSTANAAATAECVTNPNIPDAVAVANAKCMIMRKMDANGKLGSASANNIAQPGSKPGPLPGLR